MKVLTINYHNALNYGAVFQALALQDKLAEMGCDVSILDYRNRVVEQEYRFKRLRFNRNFMLDLKYNASKLPFIMKKRQNFKQWERYFKLTKPVSKSDLCEIAKQFDVVITGSDQVWNFSNHGGDLAYVLDFVDAQKRVSYAASFGKSTLASEEEELLSKELKKFRAISVRESSGAELVKQLIDCQVQQVLDPVLLQSREYWKSHMASINPPKNKYLFVYQIGVHEVMTRYIKEFAKCHGLDIYFVADHIRTIMAFGGGAHNLSAIGPSEFLAYLSCANCVLTNSFHATALSLLFEVPFYSLVRGDKQNRCNTRIYDLLDKGDLLERIVDTESQPNPQNPYEEISFQRFHEKLKQERPDSEKFLQEVIYG